MRKPRFIGPLLNAHAFPFVGKNDICGPVISLGFLRRPSGVFWRVSHFVIYSVKTMFFWPRANIGKKVEKPFFSIRPPSANINSSASISVVSPMVRERTPLDHTLPRCVFWSGAKQVFSVHCLWGGLKKASTGLYGSSFQMTKPSNLIIPAVAPKNNFVSVTGVGNCCQQSVFLSDYFSVFTHSLIVTEKGWARRVATNLQKVGA